MSVQHGPSVGENFAAIYYFCNITVVTIRVPASQYLSGFKKHTGTLNYSDEEHAILPLLEAWAISSQTYILRETLS